MAQHQLCRAIYCIHYVASVHQRLWANETKLWNIRVGILMWEYLTPLLKILTRTCTLRNPNLRVNARFQGVNHPLTRPIWTNDHLQDVSIKNIKNFAYKISCLKESIAKLTNWKSFKLPPFILKEHTLNAFKTQTLISVYTCPLNIKSV